MLDQANPIKEITMLTSFLRRFWPTEWPSELETSGCCGHDAYDHEDLRGPCCAFPCRCQEWKPRG